MPVMSGSSVPAGRDPAREAASAVVQNILAARQTNAAQMGARASMMKAKTAESLAPFQQAATVVGGLSEAVKAGTSLWSTYHATKATKQATEAARLQNEYNAATIETRVIDSQLKLMGNVVKLAELGIPTENILEQLQSAGDSMVRNADMNMSMSARRDARGKRSAMYNAVKGVLKARQSGPLSFRESATDVLTKDGSFDVFNERFSKDLISTLGEKWGEDNPDFIRFKQNWTTYLKKHRWGGHLDDAFEYYREQVPSGLKDILWPGDQQDWHKKTGEFFDDSILRTLEGMGLNLKSLQPGNVYGMSTGGAVGAVGTGGKGTGADQAKIEASRQRRALSMDPALKSVEASQKKGLIPLAWVKEVGGSDAVADVASALREQTYSGQGATPGTNVNVRKLQIANQLHANWQAQNLAPLKALAQQELLGGEVPAGSSEVWGNSGSGDMRILGSTFYAKIMDPRPESKDSIYSSLGMFIDPDKWGGVPIDEIGSLQQGKVGMPIDSPENNAARIRNQIAFDVVRKFNFVKGASRASNGRMVAEYMSEVLIERYGEPAFRQIVNTLEGAKNQLTNKGSLPRTEAEAIQIRSMDDLIAGLQKVSEDDHSYQNASFSARLSRIAFEEDLRKNYEIEGRGSGEIKAEYIRIPATVIQSLDPETQAPNFVSTEDRSYELEDVVNALWSGSAERPRSWEEMVFGEDAGTHAIDILPPTGIMHSIGRAYLAKDPTESQKELVAIAKEAGIEKPSGSDVNMASGGGAVTDDWVNKFVGGDDAAKLSNIQRRIVDSGIETAVQKKMANKFGPQKDKYTIDARRLADKARMAPSDVTAPSGKNSGGISNLYNEISSIQDNLDRGQGSMPERMALWLNQLTHATALNDEPLHDEIRKRMVEDTNHQNNLSVDWLGDDDKETGQPLGSPGLYYEHEVVQKAAQRYAFAVAGRMRNVDQPHYNKFGAGRVTKGYGERQLVHTRSTGDLAELFDVPADGVKSPWIKVKNRWLKKRLQVLGGEKWGKKDLGPLAELLGHPRPVNQTGQLNMSAKNRNISAAVYSKIRGWYKSAYGIDISPEVLDQVINKLPRSHKLLLGSGMDQIKEGDPLIPSIADMTGMYGPKNTEKFFRYIQKKVGEQEDKTSTYEYGVIGEEDQLGRTTTIFDFEESLGAGPDIKATPSMPGTSRLFPHFPVPPVPPKGPESAASATPGGVDEEGIFYETGGDDAKGWNTPGYHGVPRDIYGKRIPLEEILGDPELLKEYGPFMDPDKPGPGEGSVEGLRQYPGLLDEVRAKGDWREGQIDPSLQFQQPSDLSSGEAAAKAIESLLEGAPDEPINAPLPTGAGNAPPVGPGPSGGGSQLVPPSPAGGFQLVPPSPAGPAASVDLEKLMKDLGLAGMPNFQTGDSAYNALTQGMGLPPIQSTPNLAPEGPPMGILSDILERLTKEESYPPNLDPAMLEQLLNATGNNPN